jgi:hypothetical protein
MFHLLLPHFPSCSLYSSHTFPDFPSTLTLPVMFHLLLPHFHHVPYIPPTLPLMFHLLPHFLSCSLYSSNTSPNVPSTPPTLPLMFPLLPHFLSSSPYSSNTSPNVPFTPQNTSPHVPSIPPTLPHVPSTPPTLTLMFHLLLPHFPSRCRVILNTEGSGSVRRLERMRKRALDRFLVLVFSNRSTTQQRGPRHGAQTPSGLSAETIVHCLQTMKPAVHPEIGGSGFESC